MLEPWRSRYLQALGVDIYVPRMMLPGAHPPLEPAWDPAALIPQAPAALIPELTVEAPAVPAAREAMSLPELGAPKEARPATPPRAAKAAESPVAAATGTRFTLTVVQAEGGVVIVDDAPAGGARAEYQKLLGNLLFALQHRPAAFSVDLFQWPPSMKMSQLDQGESAARETLTAYLQKRLGEGGTLLLLGENAAHWVPEELRGQLSQQPLRCGISAVSAWACLRYPSVKRQLWQNLRALAAPR